MAAIVPQAPALCHERKTTVITTKIVANTPNVIRTSNELHYKTHNNNNNTATFVGQTCTAVPIKENQIIDKKKTNSERGIHPFILLK